MPRLDDRLKAVSGLIRAKTHADIGSDHGHLLADLLDRGRIEFGIAIENKATPLANSRRTLAARNAVVRSSDGFDGIMPGEIDSVSLCGMGAANVVRILSRHPDRVPRQVIVQPEKHPERVRKWGLDAGFHLATELSVPSRPRMRVLHFVASDCRAKSEDPAYAGIEQESAILWGPHHVRNPSDDFRCELAEEYRYFESLPGRDAEAQHRMTLIHQILHRTDP